MGFVHEDCLEGDSLPPSENSEMEKKTGMPFLTGTSYFIEELEKRTFKSGEEILQVMSPEMLTTDYLYKNGFTAPIALNSTEGLDLMVPPYQNWSDIEEHIGGDAKVEVIDVEKQDPSIIDFSTFIKYMKKTKRHRVFNLISLECSKTRLGPMIEPPRVARELDWVSKFWPNEDEFARPKVQKYCLISPKNAYTDFHIDFGGTSVWYHIVKGEKVFYVIRPTRANKSLYWNWSESRNRLQTFFADQVDECFKCTLRAGATLFLPTGWIHAVLTTEDSLVYGGNFLHSLNIEEQLEIYSVETKLKTPPRYLFPQFEDLHWLAAHGLMQELDLLNKQNSPAPNYLLHGLKAILVHLRQWLPNPRMKRMTTRHMERPRMFFATDEAYILLKEISRQIRNAERLLHLINPPKPERGSTRTRKKPVHEDFIDFTAFRKKTPKRDTAEPSTKTVPEIGNQNWHILNGGMKVVIKKLSDFPSTSSGTMSSSNGPVGIAPSLGLDRLIEKDVDDDENSLRIVEYPEVEISTSPRSHHRSSSQDSSEYLQSMDLQLDKMIQRKQNITSVLKEPASFEPGSEGLSNLSFGSINYGERDLGTEIDGITTKPISRRKRQRASSKTYTEDSRVTSNVVHQDDDYIYPSLELTDDETEEAHPPVEKYDESWCPKARVGLVVPKPDRPSRIGKQKIAVGKGLEAAAASEHSTPKVPPKSSKVKVLKKKKVVKPPKIAVPITHGLLETPAPVLPPTPSKTANKPKTKKGLATPKQRLGKILKIHKLRR